MSLPNLDFLASRNALYIAAAFALSTGLRGSSPFALRNRVSPELNKLSDFLEHPTPEIASITWTSAIESVTPIVGAGISTILLVSTVDAHPVIIVTKNIKIIFEIKFFIIFIALTILKHRNWKIDHFENTQDNLPAAIVVVNLL